MGILNRLASNSWTQVLLWPQPPWTAGPVDACCDAWLRYLLLSVWTSALSHFSHAVRVWFPYGQRTCCTFGVSLSIFYGVRSFIWLDLYLNSVEFVHWWEFPWAGACLVSGSKHNTLVFLACLRTQCMKTQKIPWVRVKVFPELGALETGTFSLHCCCLTLLPWGSKSWSEPLICLLILPTRCCHYYL